MEDEALITKARLMQGKNDTKDVKTSTGIFRIRQLTVGEKNVADAKMTRGLVAVGGLKGLHIQQMKGEAGTFMENMSNYNCYLIACALSLKEKDAEKWTPEDVENSTMPEDVIETLIDEIERFTGMQKKGDTTISVETFRKDT